jgi:phage tail-like protein
MKHMIQMNNLLPVIPQPPDDPTWWLLNPRVGWHTATVLNVGQAPVNSALALAPLPGSGRSLNEASGSFGGITLPLNVALGPDNNIYLLDTKTIELKRFDPCECLFKTVPCLGGKGKGRRQLMDPHGIGICAGNLYICDTDNHRLSVFALQGFVFRAAWMPPSAKLNGDWKPYAIAFDGKGRVFVTDGANGCIHRFSPSGHWQTCLGGFGKVTNIAIDCEDRLYVMVEGAQNSVQVVDTNGQPLDTLSRPDQLISRFPSLPFSIDAQGYLYLAGFCPDIKQQGKQSGRLPLRGVFDPNGDPVTSVTAQSGPLYYKDGLYISEELDSKFYQCQWHRVVLRGQVPKGSRIIVSTYTAEVLQSKDFVANLPDEAWKTNQAVYQMDSGGQWDCLVRSGGGRYLWLRLQLRGSGSVTPTLDSAQIEFPRISLRRYLPAVFAEDPSGTQFTDRFLSIFDTTLRSVEKEIDTQARYFDPLSTSADPDPQTGTSFLSWLASWIGVVLDRQMPEAKRRQLLKRAANLYHIRGTREGLRQLLLFYLDMEPETNCCPDDQPRTVCRPEPTNCEPVKALPCAWQPPPLILEHFQLRRWLFLGTGRLSDQAVLWGKRIVNRSQLDAGAQVSQTQLITTQDPFRDPFHFYAHKFSVFVPASYSRSDAHRKALENLLTTQRPAHTLAQLVFVEPRFRIGFQSMIGLDSVIGRYPEGVTLDTTTLGRESVLGEPPYKQGGPTFRIGEQSRLGTTTKLD